MAESGSSYTILVSENGSQKRLIQQQVHLLTDTEATARILIPGTDSDINTEILRQLGEKGADSTGNIYLLSFECVSLIHDFDQYADRLQAVAGAIRRQYGADVKIYGFFFLPEESTSSMSKRKNAQAYESLMKMELYLERTKTDVFTNLILISGESETIQKQTISAAVSLEAYGGSGMNHAVHFFDDWKKKSGRFLNSSSLMNGSVKKDNVFPEDTYAYSSFGYAAEQPRMEKYFPEALRAINDELKRQSVPSSDSQKKDEAFYMSQMQYLLGLTGSQQPDRSYWSRLVDGLLRQYAKLPDNSQKLTREEINFGIPESYINGYPMKEQIEKGREAVRKELEASQQKMQKRAEQLVAEQGPEVLVALYNGWSANQDNSLEKFLETGEKVFAQYRDQVPKRPQQKIVGTMSESALNDRIAEWTNYLKGVLEAEIQQQIAQYFAGKAVWERLIINPMRNYAVSCQRTFEKRQTKEVADTVTTLSLSECFDYYYRVSGDREMRQILHRFAGRLLPDLAKKSAVLMRTDGKGAYRKGWLMVPEELESKGWYPAWKEEAADYLHSLSMDGCEWQQVCGWKGQDIVCCQTVGAIPVYAVKGFSEWKSEEMKKKTAEISKTSKDKADDRIAFSPESDSNVTSSSDKKTKDSQKDTSTGKGTSSVSSTGSGPTIVRRPGSGSSGAPKKKFCRWCGEPLKYDNMLFCIKCGRKVN